MVVIAVLAFVAGWLVGIFTFAQVTRRSLNKKELPPYFAGYDLRFGNKKQGKYK